ncbi:GDPmannose pyrophosphorylase [Pelomyxa schiedti]|nr:GDPmannose pyrophosphorylase [Pelomyxa schiedti]
MSKAVILVGGYGTRLRPLTLTTPKPLVEFCNAPTILHQIRALAAVGVVEVILAVSYKPDQMMEYLEPHQGKLGVKIRYSQELEPLGTAGPLALCRESLTATNDPFFVMNSDITCEFPLADMLAFHKRHGHEGTILVTKVEDPTKYGVVVFEETGGLVSRFVEKPKTFVGDKINAGVYILQPSILNRIRPVKTSIEREVFPNMASEGQLHAFVLPGFWMDVGQPRDYLLGTQLYLSHIAQHRPQLLHSAEVVASNTTSTSASSAAATTTPRYTIIQPALVDPTARLGDGCVIGPNVCIGPNCVVGEGARLNNTTMLEGSIVKAHAWVHTSIIGWKSVVGKWVRMENLSVLGKEVTIADELYINGAKVLPFKDVTASVPLPEVLM